MINNSSVLCSDKNFMLFNFRPLQKAVKKTDYSYNEKTKTVIDEVEKGINVSKAYDDLDEFFKDLNA